MTVTTELPEAVARNGAAADRDFVRNVHAPYAARRFARAQLLAWGVPGLIDACEVVVSELATNAVEHGTGEFIGVRLERRRDGVITVKVWDANGAALPEAAAPADVLSENGRGLLLTEALSEAWGSYRVRPAGKVIWARITCR